MMIDRFNEAVRNYATRLGNIPQPEMDELWKTFEQARISDIKLTFDRFLYFHAKIDAEKRHKLRLSATEKVAPRIPGFRIIEILGSGGMGEVYKAKQKALERIVALKVLSDEHHDNEEYLLRFTREARTAARIDHQNVVRTYDVFTGDRAKKIPPYIVMEYIEGFSLHEILRKKSVLGEKQALKIAISLARAMHAVHEAGLIHRDIKPDNIIITNEGKVKLCDLGLAKDVGRSQDLTQPGVTHGTPHYMSPEQAHGESDIDIRTDLYAMGCTIFRILAGRTPFIGNSALEILMQHISSEMPAITEFRPQINEDFKAVIAKLLQKRRENRYETPADLLADLERLAKGRKPLASGRDEGTEPEQSDLDFIDNDVADIDFIDEPKPRPAPEPLARQRETGRRRTARRESTGKRPRRASRRQAPTDDSQDVSRAEIKEFSLPWVSSPKRRVVVLSLLGLGLVLCIAGVAGLASSEPEAKTPVKPDLNPSKIQPVDVAPEQPIGNERRQQADKIIHTHAEIEKIRASRADANIRALVESLFD